MQIIEMNRSGDERTVFDTADSEQVELAMEHFNALIGRGLFASVPSGDGHSGRAIKEFDPEAETIIFRTQYAGG